MRIIRYRLDGDKTMPIILVWDYGHYIIMCKHTRFTSYRVHEATSEVF